MEIIKSNTINFRDEEASDYEISVCLYENSIKMKIKCLDDYSKYEKLFQLKELLEYRPFMIIDEINEIYEVIIEGLNYENSIKIKRAENLNLIITFNTFFAKKYTNSFEIELVMNESISTDSFLMIILRQVKKLKMENNSLKKDMEILKKDNEDFKEANELYRREIIFLKDKITNLAVYDIIVDEFINFENYNYLSKCFDNKRFKFDVIYQQDGNKLCKSDLKLFKNKIKYKKDLLFLVSFFSKPAKSLAFYQSIELDKDLNSENYYEDKRSFITDFAEKKVFYANSEATKHIRTCSGYYFLFGNDGNFNGFYIRDDTSSLPNIYAKTEYFKNLGSSNKVGFEFKNEDIDKLVVYMLDFSC